MFLGFFWGAKHSWKYLITLESPGGKPIKLRKRSSFCPMFHKVGRNLNHFQTNVSVSWINLVDILLISTRWIMIYVNVVSEFSYHFRLSSKFPVSKNEAVQVTWLNWVELDALLAHLHQRYKWTLSVTVCCRLRLFQIQLKLALNMLG